jgi:23S rRNA (cytidine1920-2'-O)/16S rRNA (cytidine1409-2'-O)-methyltransferase
VRDSSVHEEVVTGIVDFALANGFSVCNLEFSPIKGPEGNIEYLVHLLKSESPQMEDGVDLAGTVAAAHEELDK